jgi:hypothetical protein
MTQEHLFLLFGTNPANCLKYRNPRGNAAGMYMASIIAFLVLWKSKSGKVAPFSSNFRIQIPSKGDDFAF